MEATNISIKQQSSVSINVETLQAIKQRVLSVVVNSSLFTLHFSLCRLYRMVLLMSRAAVRTIDAHPTISNIFLWTMCAACFWAVLTYNFTTHI